MLAIAVESHQVFRSLLKSVIHSGLQRGALAEIDHMAQAMHWLLRNAGEGLVRRTVIDNDDLMAQREHFVDDCG